MKTQSKRLSEIFAYATAILCGTFAAMAQSPSPILSPWQVGAFGHAGSTLHTANFQKLPGVPNCCPRFENGSGTALGVGALVNFYVSPSTALGLRFGFASFDGTLQKEEGTTVIVNGSAQAGSFIHTLNAKLSAFSLQPHLHFGILSNMYLEVGAELAMLRTADYAQQETIGQPSGQGTFLDALGQDSHSRIRNQFSGALPGAAGMLILPSATVGYEIPLTRRHNITLSPEIRYSYGLTSVVGELDWKVQQIRAGIALAYRPLSLPLVQQEFWHIDTLRIQRSNLTSELIAQGSGRSTEFESIENDVRIQRREIYRTDTLYYPEVIAEHREQKPVEIQPEKFNISLKAVAVDDERHEDDTLRIQIRQYSNLLLTPLLNYIFFEEGRAELPARYAKLSQADTARFDENKHNSIEKLPTYYQILNIIGKRLHQYPAATLRLVGCNSNRGAELGDTALSRKRAEAVFRYLRDVWGIVPQRMNVSVRNLPEYASNPDSADGAAENRRVELWSPVYEILKPVITSDTTTYARSMDVHVRPKVETSSEINTWNIGVRSKSQLVFTKSSQGAVPEDVIWNLSTEEQSHLQNEKLLTVHLHVKSKKGDSADAVTTLGVTSQYQRSRQRNIVDSMEVDRYSLILFDVRSSELKHFNSQIIDFIRQRIGKNSQVFVEGFTDRLGESNYNQALAKSRAEETAHALGHKIQSVKGHGEANTYNNDLPEGRHYTRTVDVVVQSPLK